MARKHQRMTPDMNPREIGVEKVRNCLRENCGRKWNFVTLVNHHFIEFWQVGPVEVILHLHYSSQNSLIGFEVLTSNCQENNIDATIQALQEQIDSWGDNND